MPDLSIFIDAWTGAGHGPPEDTITSGLLRIEAKGTCLTRNDNTWSKSVVDWVHVPAYPAALWLAANWWRICFEPPTRLTSSRDSDWRAAHELPAAGGGFLWPPLEIVGDGEQVFLKSLSRDSGQPIRYLAALEIPVPLDSFENAATLFVDTVVERLRAANLARTELEELWKEVRAERANPDASRLRRFEAAMHYDPDEAPPAELTALAVLNDEAGTDATNEIAAALRGDDAVSTLSWLRSVARNGESARGFWQPVAELADRCRGGACCSQRLATERGAHRIGRPRPTARYAPRDSRRGECRGPRADGARHAQRHGVAMAPARVRPARTALRGRPLARRLAGFAGQ
jgi:hypothetical protein